MYKQFITIFGLLLSIGAIVVLLFTDTSPSDQGLENFTQEAKDTLVQKQANTTAISYETSAKTSTKTAHVRASQSANPIHTPTTNSTTTVARARTKKYDIFIDDPSNTTKQHRDGSIAIYGTIGGEAFEMRVPKDTIKSYDATITLNVVNRQSGETQSVSADFLSDVSTNPNSVKETINIDEDSISNIEHEQKHSILPPV